MDGKQLKNSILQWAIQGKLVPQNPKDEPAQKLLERIAASRNESSLSLPKGTSSTSLRGAKATKQSKNPTSRIYRENGVWYEQIGTATPKDISDEIPFEIPETWAWCRLDNLGTFVRGNGIKRDETVSTGKPCVRYGEMYTTYRVKFSDIKSHTTSNIFDKCQKFHKDDILMALTGENKWDIALAAVYQGDQEVALGGDMCKFSPFESNSLYLVYLINSPYGIGYKRETSTGDIIVHTSVGKLGNFLIPLPPLAEQKRIVAKLEQVLPLAEEYGAAQEQLDKLNKELPEALKKSILQEAIQGKLVPQNSKDEPAQKLLERIAASRNGDVSPWSEAIGSSKNSKKSLSTSLRGAKATKQSKNPPSRIYRENGVWYEQIGTAIPKDITDEIPFEIPETWAWCRLGNCSDYAASKEKAKSFENIQEMWSLDLEDIEKNSGRIVKRLKVRERKIVGEKVVFKKGQVLYSKLRPYLKKILVAPEDGVCSSEIVPFSPFEYLDADYLVTVLKSPHVDYTINLVTYGVKMPRVGTDTMLNLLIPLPPLAEQKRIVDKLEQLFKVL